jgi:hypothetical protein
VQDDPVPVLRGSDLTARAAKHDHLRTEPATPRAAHGRVPMRWDPLANRRSARELPSERARHLCSATRVCHLPRRPRGRSDRASPDDPDRVGIAAAPSREAARSHSCGRSRGDGRCGTGPLARYRLAPRRREITLGRQCAREFGDVGASEAIVRPRHVRHLLLGEHTSRAQAFEPIVVPMQLGSDAPSVRLPLVRGSGSAVGSSETSGSARPLAARLQALRRGLGDLRGRAPLESETCCGVGAVSLRTGAGRFGACLASWVVEIAVAAPEWSVL